MTKIRLKSTYIQIQGGPNAEQRKKAKYQDLGDLPLYEDSLMLNYQGTDFEHGHEKLEEGREYNWIIRIASPSNTISFNLVPSGTASSEPIAFLGKHFHGLIPETELKDAALLQSLFNDTWYRDEADSTQRQKVYDDLSANTASLAGTMADRLPRHWNVALTQASDKERSGVYNLAGIMRAMYFIQQYNPKMEYL